MYNAMQNLFLFYFFKFRTTDPHAQSVNLLRLAWKLSHKYFVEILQPDSDSMVPTVTDNLYNLGFLPENKIAIFLNPLVTTSADAIGEIAWGMFIYLLKILN